MKPSQRLVSAIARLLRVDVASLAAVTARVDDGPDGLGLGWTRTGVSGIGGAPNERDSAEIQQQYSDALTAWRKNPMAKRIIDVTTDYCLGDGLTPTAPGQLGTWIDRWWHHPKNNMPVRLHELSDELSRCGDLFMTLHRNPDDGISYVRPIPKDRITRIETLPNDWETEIAFHESAHVDGRRWLSPNHPAAPEADAVMVHYAVNRVAGALMGESDLGTILPWLLRYSRMLEDRVRLHWATKIFLWIVTVPTNLVAAKREQYNAAPKAGSVVIKDDQETWEPVTPNLHAFDARYDLQTVRNMIDAGSGFPPHWRGEATDVNLATATAMERAASRHLRRRQLYLRFMVGDLSHLAYSRAYELRRMRCAPDARAIQVEAPDISRQDNKELATAANSMAGAMAALDGMLPGESGALRARMLRLVFKFAAEPLAEDELARIVEELENG